MSRHLLVLTTGPCMGTYETARAPLALRAVRRESDGRCDVLDLLDDAPEPGELVYLYRRDPGARAGHVCLRRPSRCLTVLDYAYVGALDQVTGELAELSDADREWWATQRDAAMRAWAFGDRFDVPASPPPQGALFV